MTEQLPRGWVRAALNDLISSEGLFSDGDWVESKDQDPDGNVRLIQLADIGVGTFRNRSNRFLSSTKATELKCTYLTPEDVLVARMPDPLGRACQFPSGFGPCVTVVDVAIVRPDKGSIHPVWLMWSINSPQFRQQVLELQSGTTRKRISRKNLGTIELGVPPFQEQKRIVQRIKDMFTRLDKVESTLKSLLDQVKDLCSAILAYKLYINADLPADWRTVALEEVAEVILGQSPPGHSYNDRGEGMPFFQGKAEFGALYPTATKWTTEPKKLAERGDVLLSVRAPVGPTNIAPYRCAIGRGLHAIRSLEDVNRKYLLWSLRVSADRLRDKSTGSTFAAVTGKQVRSHEINLPSMEEQKQVVLAIERPSSLLDAIKDSLQNGLDGVATLRQLVLAEAFAGRLVSQDPNDESASALLERIAESQLAKAARRTATV